MTQESFNERLVWLLQLSRRMLATRELEPLLRLVTDAFIELTSTDRAFLLLKERQADQLLFHTGRSKEETDIQEEPKSILSVAKRVLSKKEPLLLTQADAQQHRAARRSSKEQLPKMMICIPLASDTGLTGVLYADCQKAKDDYDTRTISRVCSILADHVAAAIENARMFERAQNDPLTGLPNSSYFVLQASKVVREATVEAHAGILLLDLDNFKRINAIAGAEMGDRALIDVATSLRDVLRTDGLVARYGSDKFGILLPADNTNRIDIRLRDVAERARACVRTKAYHGIAMSASIGGIAFPGPKADNAPDLIAMAEDNLATARKSGGGAVEIH